MTERIATSPIKKALAAIEELEARLAALQHEKSEPIAIVGMGCRFPGGVHSPEQFWEMLATGRSALSPVPPSRWGAELYDVDPDAPGKIYVQGGYFLDSIDGFDAAFFGISPREAEQMDPQQRLLLEVAWEALERSAQPWDRLRDSKTGVFIGVANNDYAQLMFRSGEYRDVDSFSGTGNAYSFLTGRLAYLLGLQGPAVSIDTACSSSLVAIHLACASLRSRESDCALAGGVQIVVSPITEVFLCRSRALSADGTCKAFDAAADGYGRGEGCGIVVLKRLSDALAQRDMIWGVIRSSAVNHDGASSGLTVPNPRAQVRVLETALKNAALDPHSIDYIEAHGVGTPIGDPIEMRTIASVLGAGRSPERPVYVGSAKTNIGHLEGAAGIAGFIKTVLALKNAQIPRNLHFQTPSPGLEWARMPVVVPTEHLPWPHTQLPRRGAVNAFGLSGTNAHVILESPPPVATATADQAEPFAGYQLLPLSAKTPGALRALAAEYSARVASWTDADLGDIAFTLGSGRAHFHHRQAIVARDLAELRAELENLRAGRQSRALQTGQVGIGETPRVVFLFTGQGSQYAGMGRALYETYPVFRRTIDRCDALLRDPSLLGVSLREVMHEGSPDDDRLASSLLAQVGLFSFEVALSDLWRSFGITPDLVLGHSLGEYAAACVAGVFSLEAGLRLLVHRGRLVESLTSEGEMATVFASESELLPHLEPFAGEVGIAAINGPEIVVLSGVRRAMGVLLPRLAAAGLRIVRLPIAQAYHSPLVEPILEDFRQAAAQVKFSPPHTPLVSNLTAQVAGAEIATPEYWCQHLRHAVRFSECLTWLHRENFELLVEIGPEPVLLAFDQCLPEGIGADHDARIQWLPSVRRGLDERKQLMESLATLYVRGCTLDFHGLHQGSPRRGKVLPTYPFERKPYWGIRKREDTLTPRASSPEATPDGGVTALLAKGDFDALMRIVEAREPLSAEARARVSNALLALADHHRAVATSQKLEGAVYRTLWQEQALEVDSGAADLTGVWLIVAEPFGTALEVARQLEQQGGFAVFVKDGAAYAKLGEQDWSVRFDAPEDFRALLAEVRQEFPGTRFGGAILVEPESKQPSESTSTLEELETRGLRRCGALLHLLQSTACESESHHGRLWAVTRGAIATGSEEPAALQPFAAPLWGAAKVAALEFPQLWGGIIDTLGVTSAMEEGQRIVAEIAARGVEDQVVFRGNTRLVPRLVPATLGSTPYPFDPEARYVITGGLGFLGLSIANWAVAQGARRLVLVGRRAPDEAARTAVAELEAAGAQVEYLRADVTDRAAMQALFEPAVAGTPPIRGIFHLAGLAGYIETARLPFDKFLAVLGPKITGARILHEVAQGFPLDFFFCSSSLSSVWGYKGGFHYAAANAFLDAFMHYRRMNGTSGLSINIGPCAGGGVAEPQFLEILKKVGVVPITPDLVTEALGRLLAGSEPTTMVARMDWPVFTEIYQAQRPSPFLSSIAIGAPAGPGPAGQESKSSPVIAALREATPGRRRELIVRALQREVAAVLRLESDQPDPLLGFFAMGMESILVMELRARIQRTFEFGLPATVVFNKPTIAALADHLLSTLPALQEHGAEAPAPAALDAVLAGVSTRAALDALSEDELESMLDRTLQSLPVE